MQSKRDRSQPEREDDTKLSPLRRWEQCDEAEIDATEVSPGKWHVKPKVVSPKERPELLARRQRAMRDALLSAEPLPAELRQILASGFTELVLGNRVELFEPLLKAGRPVKTPARIAQRVAAEYVLSASNDDDRQARLRKVAEEFDVSNKTVGAWEQQETGTHLPASHSLRSLRKWADVYKRHRPQFPKQSRAPRGN